MPTRGVDHIDLAVSDVDRSLAFYLGVLDPIDLAVEGRFRIYRGTEDVVYLGFGYEHLPGAQPETRLGLRRADGGKHHYFEVAIEHLAFTVDSRSEVDDAYSAVSAWTPGSTSRQRRNWTATTPSSSSTPMGFESR
jgi:catechol 2,3-dioxygenase-like lactoylglutathione lyase family enzyme